MARFVYSAMVSETIRFDLSIDKFSMVVRRGYYEGSEFVGERSDSKWSLIVYASEGAEYEDFIDIRLRRRDFEGKDQFVELKVAIDDTLGISSLSEKGQFCFTGTKNIHKVLSVSNMSQFQRLRYIPNDTLTIRGEMVVYEETQIPFGNEDDFEKSVGNPNSALCALVLWILYKALLYFAAAAGVAATLTTILYAIKNILLPFLQDAIDNIVLPFLQDVVLPFILIVLLITTSLFWLRRTATRRQSNARYYSPMPNGHSRGGMELVPVADGEYRQPAKYHSGGKNYDKPMKNGGYRQRVIYVLDAGHYSGRHNRYLYE